MTNDHLNQTEFESFFRETMLPPLPGGCALVAIASAHASIIQSVYYFFDHNHTCGLLNISALHVQYDMESRHLLNSSVQNALDCISENFNLKNFPGGACARNSVEKCAVRSPDGRCGAHIATLCYISRPPLSQNPPSAPDPKEKFVTLRA